ncbi:MAG: Gfo/Idh/MocA family protein [Planctomycetota bacterium]
MEEHRGERVALLGLGPAGRSIHVPACRRAGLSLVAAADPQPRARELARDLASDLPLYEDPLRLLEEHAPDWVIVAAPPAAHHELCLLALRHRAHVLCEKPFVERLEAADAVLAAAKSAERQVVVNFEFPHMPIFKACLAELGGADFGRALFFQAWEHLAEHRGDAASWRQSGKTMQEFGPHVVDLAVRVFGAYPVEVIARMPQVDGASESDLIDVVTLTFPGGQVASIVLDRACRGRHRYLETRIDGEHASLRASIGGRLGLSMFVSAASRLPRVRLDFAGGGQAWREVGDRRTLLARNPRDIFAFASAQHLRAVVDAVAQGREPPNSARHAREIVRVIEAAYSSARSGGVASL